MRSAETSSWCTVEGRFRLQWSRRPQFDLEFRPLRTRRVWRPGSTGVSVESFYFDRTDTFAINHDVGRSTPYLDSDCLMRCHRQHCWWTTSISSPLCTPTGPGLARQPGATPRVVRARLGEREPRQFISVGACGFVLRDFGAEKRLQVIMALLSIVAHTDPIAGSASIASPLQAERRTPRFGRRGGRRSVRRRSRDRASDRGQVLRATWSLRPPAQWQAST